MADDLALLHDEYDVNYAELMESSAQAAVKVSGDIETEFHIPKVVLFFYGIKAIAVILIYTELCK